VLIAEGKTSKEIAALLVLSIKTVERHRADILHRLGMRDRVDLTRYAIRRGLIEPALRAGVPVFALSRFIGTSIAMIDLHYGHLAIDSHQHAVSLLDALALERAVDAGWTPAHRAIKPHHDTVSRARGSHSRRAVDAQWTSRPDAVATSAVRRG
jgi:hypothetical protein